MVLALVVPMIIQNGITNFVNLLDNIMVGQLGTESISGVGIANQLIFVYNLALFGGLSGAGIFTSQFFGKKDVEGMRYTFRFKLWTALMITAVGAAVLIPFGSQLISLFIVENDTSGDILLTQQYALDYLHVALLSCVPMALTFTYATTLRETGHTVPPMIASIVAVVTNGVCNYIFIFGAFGVIPAMGAVGAAWGTVVARTVEMCIILIWTHTHRVKAPYIVGAYRSPRVPLRLCGTILVKGMPLLINEVLWSTGMTVMNQVYSTRGLAALAAVNIAVTVANLFNIVYMSMGNAVGIIVGRQLGAGDIEEAKDTDRKIIAFSCVLCVVIGGTMALLAPLITQIYEVEDEVRMLAAYLIMIHAAMMPFNSFLHNCYFTLRSGGQSLITFLFDSAFVWAVSVPVAKLLAFGTDLPIIPLVALCVSLDLIKCVIGFILLKSGKWARKLV